jgi:hypothetical protein
VISPIGIVPIALDLLWRDENALPIPSAPPALSSRCYRTRSSTATRRAESEAREAALRIAGGAWSKAAAVTARCSIVARRRLSECRAGNEHDQRESGDKPLHDTSPSWTVHLTHGADQALRQSRIPKRTMWPNLAIRYERVVRPLRPARSLWPPRTQIRAYRWCSPAKDRMRDNVPKSQLIRR